MAGAILRLIVDYPREWDTFIDETELRKHTTECFEFHLVKRPQFEARVRLAEGQVVSSLTPLELLNQYWRAAKVEKAEDVSALQSLAQEIILEDRSDEES